MRALAKAPSRPLRHRARVRRCTRQGKELARKATELDPAFFFPIFKQGYLALLAGDYAKAIAQFERARALGAPSFVTPNWRTPVAWRADRPRAMAALGELKGMSPGGEVAPYNMALLDLGLGDHARALDYLEQAYAANSQQVFWLKVDPLWDPLRSEPRFIALLKRLNFVK